MLPFSVSCSFNESTSSDDKNRDISKYQDSEINHKDENQIAENLFKEILQITDGQFIGSCKVGEVYGDATIMLSSNLTASVNYSALGYSAEEYGDLKNVTTETGGELGTLIVRADWDNKIAGDGTLTMKILNEEFPHTIYVSIRGSGWAYFSYLELSNESFDKVKTILKDSKVSESETTTRKEIQSMTSTLVPNTELDIASMKLQEFSRIIMNNSTEEFPSILEDAMKIYHSRENMELIEIIDNTEKFYFSKWIVLNDSIISVKSSDNDDSIFEYEKYYVIQRKSDNRKFKYMIRGICALDGASQKFRIMKDIETKRL